MKSIERAVKVMQRLKSDLLLRGDEEAGGGTVVNVSAGIWDEFKSALEELESLKTVTQRDGTPSFYASQRGLPPCTHRTHETDIPVWCGSAPEASVVMDSLTYLRQPHTGYAGVHVWLGNKQCTRILEEPTLINSKLDTHTIMTNCFEEVMDAFADQHKQ